MAANKNGTPIFTHTYPVWLLRYPQAIRLVYAFNYLTQLRKWYIMPAIARQLRGLPAGFSVLDAGIGEGQFLFPYAAQYPHAQFQGVDKIAANVSLCRQLAHASGLGNVSIEEAYIEAMDFQQQFQLALCIGVLQYIEDDVLALQKLQQALAPGGRLLLYSPVNNRILTPFYRKLFNTQANYESAQGRKRIYTERELRSKLGKAGLHITEATHTYGFWGRLSHELFNSCVLLAANGPLIVKLMSAILLMLLYPAILCCMALDFLLPVRGEGNGILLIAEKR